MIATQPSQRMAATRANPLALPLSERIQWGHHSQGTLVQQGTQGQQGTLLALGTMGTLGLHPSELLRIRFVSISLVKEFQQCLQPPQRAQPWAAL